MTKNDVIVGITQGTALPPIAKGIVATLIRQMTDAQFEVLLSQANSVIGSIKANNMEEASSKLQKIGLPKELLDMIMKHVSQNATIASNGNSTQ